MKPAFRSLQVKSKMPLRKKYMPSCFNPHASGKLCMLAGNMTVESLHLGANIRTTVWGAQNDILGHPAVKVFVTQAGINSLYEAAFHGKPIVSVPMAADQPDNAAKVHHVQSSFICAA